MKRLLSFLALAILGPIGRMPAWAQLTTLGVGGVAAVIGILTPPSVTPQPSAAFTQSNSYGSVNMGLKTNGGSVGAFEMPGATTPNCASVTCSWALYHEFTVDPSIGGSYKQPLSNSVGTGFGGIGVTSTNSGSPSIFIQNSVPSYSGFWWNATTGQGVSSYTKTGAGYNPGFYNWTAAGGCPSGNGYGAREPQGTLLAGVNGAAYTVDPGFLCSENSSGEPPQVNFAAIAGVGATQSTGSSSTPPAAATTCASNTPTSGQFTVTVNVGVAHGKSPGQSFTLAGFSPSGLNETYAAIAGTGATTLVGAYSNGTGTCPTGSITEGTITGGAGDSLVLGTPSPTAPFASGGPASRPNRVSACVASSVSSAMTPTFRAPRSPSTRISPALISQDHRQYRRG